MTQLQLAYKELGISTTLSNEETFFYDWLLELKEAGYIEKIVIQPNYTLTKKLSLPFMKQKTMKSIDKATGKPKVKIEEQDCTILNGMSYTPDFLVIWTEKAMDKFIFDSASVLTKSFTDTQKSKFFTVTHPFDSSKKLDTILEIKGSFASRHNSTAIKFPLLQKIVYRIHNIYVNKVMPLDKKAGLFSQTFTPKTYMLTEKTKVKRAISWQVRTLKEYEDYLDSLPETLNRNEGSDKTNIN